MLLHWIAAHAALVRLLAAALGALVTLAVLRTARPVGRHRRHGYHPHHEMTATTGGPVMLARLADGDVTLVRADDRELVNA